MATRKATTKRVKAGDESTDSAPANAVKSVSKRAAASKRKAEPKPTRLAKKRSATVAAPEISGARRLRPMSAPDRERRFNLILQTACLKAGTAAAIKTITSKVPLLGKLAPVVLGSVAETVALGKIQQQLVRDILQLYELELTDAEERGVILLSTAANIGAQQLSKQTVEQLIKQFAGLLYRPVLARMLPIAALVTEIAASVASTYAVGKRAQALCMLPGTGARNLGELLGGLSGIDQTRLFKWSGEALTLAIKPFRRALSAIIPGLR
ncbi:MAG: hypothetical protein ACT4NL_12660 [Pseudomarimonas sp.]